MQRDRNAIGRGSEARSQNQKPEEKNSSERERRGVPMPEKRDSRLPDSREIHARIGSGWRDVLVRLGIAEDCLARRNVPCPACGGADRFTFDDRNGRGDFFCRGCGPGDGFDLLRRVHGWDFVKALREVATVAGLVDGHTTPAPKPERCAPIQATPSRRVRDLLRTSCTASDAVDVARYLTARRVWPLPNSTALRGHVGAAYWHDGECVGQFPALLAPVVDIGGELVTLHCTYLSGGQKLAEHEPRKLLGPLTARRGCAVRLTPATNVLGIAEGIETALAATILHRVPVWAALNAALLAKFEPPAGIERLVIFADRDIAGLSAAWQLRNRVECELREPPPPHGDWNDVLVARHA